jgi:hypothetical protein
MWLQQKGCGAHPADAVSHASRDTHTRSNGIEPDTRSVLPRASGRLFDAIKLWAW